MMRRGISKLRIFQCAASAAHFFYFRLVIFLTTKEILFDILFNINRLAIFILYVFGIDSISQKCAIPWQIIFIITLLLSGSDLSFNKKRRNKKLDSKINAFLESESSLLTQSQKREISSWRSYK